MAININPGTPLRHVETFNSSGTWISPVGTNLAFVSVHGASAGGTGAGRYGQSLSGQTSLVGGAYVQVTGGGSHVITIGAGGAGGTPVSGPTFGNNGGTGGTTSFDGRLTITGSTNSGNGSGSGSTSLTALNPGASTLVSTGTITTQTTGGIAGGSGGSGNSRYGSGNSGSSGSAGQIHVYI